MSRTGDCFDNAPTESFFATLKGSMPSVRLTTELILSQVPGGGGAAYTFTDSSVLPNHTYYYTLESIDVGGISDTFGPLQVTVP